MALWPAKKEQDEEHLKIEIPEALQPAGGHPADAAEAPDPLEQICARLGQLGELLSQANRQVLAYLIDRQSEAPADDRATAALTEKIDGLAEKLARLETRLKAPPQPAPGGSGQDSPAPGLAEFCEGVNRQYAALAGRVKQLQESLESALQRLADRLGPQEPEVSQGPDPGPAIGPAPGGDWQRALLGDELADRPGLGFQRQQLLAGVLQEDPGACALLGQLLVFRSARSDRMPPLLKEVGEAYYRWQPKSRPGSDPMEEALVDWLKDTLQEAGIANTIELVQPGERFDSTRHTASTRGVEITEIHGWIVLRDNGKVYTKASVAVR